MGGFPGLEQFKPRESGIPEPRPPGGRATKRRWSAAKRRAILEHLERGGTVAALEREGICAEPELYEQLSRFPSFNQQYQDALRKSAGSLVDQALHVTGEALKFAARCTLPEAAHVARAQTDAARSHAKVCLDIAGRRHPERFGPRQLVDVSGRVEVKAVQLHLVDQADKQAATQLARSTQRHLEELGCVAERQAIEQPATAGEDQPAEDTAPAGG